MKKFFAWLKWRVNGCPSISYMGYNCGCCGAWVKESFKVPTYKSLGKWCDTWGLCPICGGKEILPPLHWI